jgi:hypothetical protein
LVIIIGVLDLNYKILIPNFLNMDYNPKEFYEGNIARIRELISIKSFDHALGYMECALELKELPKEYGILLIKHLE